MTFAASVLLATSEAHIYSRFKLVNTARMRKNSLVRRVFYLPTSALNDLTREQAFHHPLS